LTDGKAGNPPYWCAQHDQRYHSVVYIARS
jgi:hypothetical protein